MQENGVYQGLTPSKAIDLFIKEQQDFNFKYKYPLCHLLEKEIADRVRELDGRTEEEVKKDAMGQEAAWCVRMPFAIPFDVTEYENENEHKHIQYFSGLENEVGRLDSLTMWDTDPYTGDEIAPYYVCTINDLITLYEKLNRMGFFNDKYANDFKL